jgi:hypothetical protein
MSKPSSSRLQNVKNPYFIWPAKATKNPAKPDMHIQRRKPIIPRSPLLS